MSADILGASWDQCRSMVQYSFTSTETRRLFRTDSPRRPPWLSHSSWTMMCESDLNLIKERKKKKVRCQKWDSNPRPHSWTRTLMPRYGKDYYPWVWRLRPLGHPDIHTGCGQITINILVTILRHKTYDIYLKYQYYLHTVLPVRCIFNNFRSKRIVN